MKNIHEKLQAWDAKCEKGSEKFMKLAPCGKEMVYLYLRKPYLITGMYMLADTGSGFKRHLSYEAAPDKQAPCSFGLIVKDKAAMIIEDEKLGIQAFGLKEKAESQLLKSVLVYVRTASFHSIIMADSQTNTVRVLEEVVYADAASSDAVSVCMAEILASFAKGGEADGV